MVDAILNDRKRDPALRRLPPGRVRRRRACSSACRSSSAVAGIEQIVEIELTADEQAAFDRSAAAVQELVDTMAACPRAADGPSITLSRAVRQRRRRHRPRARPRLGAEFLDRELVAQVAGAQRHPARPRRAGYDERLPGLWQRLAQP